MKVILNGSYGGFGLSRAARDLYRERTGVSLQSGASNLWMSYRTDPELIRIAEELGALANDDISDLRIQEVPDEYSYRIEDCNGREQIHLELREETLRKLIREGIEDKIVDYVMRAE